MKGVQKPLTIEMILQWADLHHVRTGRWPTSRCGPILDQPDRTWEAVQTALVKGICGLRGGSSLRQLLRARRRIDDPRRVMSGISRAQVLAWVDSHRVRTSSWPTRDAGPVADCPSISWSTIDRRLRAGELGSPRGTTLSKWLREVRGVWDGGKPRLTPHLVFKWATEHYDRFGRWPVTMSGPLVNHPEENWAAIDVAMRNARRGYPIRTSLSKLLRERLGAQYESHIGSPKDPSRPSQPRRVKVVRA
jgi:hypothetical protein